jgi:hypothetical protein
MVIVLHQARRWVAASGDHAVGEANVCGAVQPAHGKDGTRLGRQVSLEGAGREAAERGGGNWRDLFRGAGPGWGQPPNDGTPGERRIFVPKLRPSLSPARLSPRPRPRSARNRRHTPLAQHRQTTAPGEVCPLPAPGASQKANTDLPPTNQPAPLHNHHY